MIDKTLKFFTGFGMEEFEARIKVIKLTYLYYKHDSLYVKMKERIAQKGVNETTKNLFTVDNSEELVDDLVKHIQKFGPPRTRVRATLCQAYHHALHNRVNEARDLLKKTHMNSLISMQHVDNQIIYNRAIIQVGMAAFRLGNIQLSHETLVDIVQNGRLKELIGQGVNRNLDKTPEQELEERRRLMPHHMTISF